MQPQSPRTRRLLLGVLILVAAAGSRAQNEELLGALRYRNLGPHRAGAWIGDIAAPENPGPEDRYTYYVAARCGGLWKTTNNGTTFAPIFDACGTNAIGAVEVAPSDPRVIWVGTGDDSLARSSYAGNGVWKSTDGGKSFEHMGLEDSHHIPKIAIHPSNPDVVYVAAMGHLFSENPQRGVFKTTDGGKSWAHVLNLGPKIGAVDLVMDRSHPDTLFAAAYEKTRLPWHYEAGGEGSRIYRTRDGGKSWERLSAGLPGGALGRIGIDIHRADSRIVYALIENCGLVAGVEKPSAVKFDAFSDQMHQDLIGGEVYRSDDGGDTWRKVSPDGLDLSGKAAYSFNEVSVDPVDPDRVFLTGVFMQYSEDGGKSWPRGRKRKRFRSNFGDVRTFWIDPADPEHMMLGSDGGLYASWDGGRTMLHHYNLPLGEVYQVEVDQAQPYNVYAGLQDHEAWRAPSSGWSGSIGIEDWVIVGMWDGMYTKVNPENNRWLYFTTQFGKHHRVDQARGERVEITPRAPKGKPPYRYTWTTPLALSPHNPDIVYTGGQMLLRSLDRGASWEELSPDLTSDDAVKIAGQGHIMFCTITTIDESPLRAGILWVGTDDGRVWLSRNFGARWEECTGAIAAAGGPRHTWVSRVVASAHEEGTAYVAKSGYREDVFAPFLYRTRDFGASWESLGAGLPEAPVSAIWEDRVKPDLLFAGTDAGVYVSLDGGERWRSLRGNMPPVPVRDLLVHPREQDLVVGTYGRGVWITNIAPLQELDQATLEKDFHLFRILERPVRCTSQRARWGNYHMMGDAHLRTPNEAEGLRIFYYLASAREEPLTLRIEDPAGKKLRAMKTATEAGLHRIYWRPKSGKAGRFRVVLTDGARSESREATLGPRLLYPIGNPDTYR